MTDLKLFQVRESSCDLLASSTAPVEKTLQGLIERHLSTFLGVRFLASEVTTSQEYGERIDTLGVDDANRPAIIEYKRGLNENVINQGLYYMSWLVESKSDFESLVARRGLLEAPSAIDWGSPRPICVAAEFTRFDLQAVYHSHRSIDLVRYRFFEGNLVLLETVARSTALAAPLPPRKTATAAMRPQNVQKPPITNADSRPTLEDFQRHAPLARASADLQRWFRLLRQWMESLGNDVTVRITTA